MSLILLSGASSGGSGGGTSATTYSVNASVILEGASIFNYSSSYGPAQYVKMSGANQYFWHDKMIGQAYLTNNLGGNAQPEGNFHAYTAEYGNGNLKYTTTRNIASMPDDEQRIAWISPNRCAYVDDSDNQTIKIANTRYQNLEDQAPGYNVFVSGLLYNAGIMSSAYISSIDQGREFYHDNTFIHICTVTDGYGTRKIVATEGYYEYYSGDNSQLLWAVDANTDRFSNTDEFTDLDQANIHKIFLVHQDSNGTDAEGIYMAIVEDQFQKYILFIKPTAYLGNPLEGTVIARVSAGDWSAKFSIINDDPHSIRIASNSNGTYTLYNSYGALIFNNQIEVTATSSGPGPDFIPSPLGSMYWYNMPSPWEVELVIIPEIAMMNGYNSFSDMENFIMNTIVNRQGVSFIDWNMDTSGTVDVQGITMQQDSGSAWIFRLTVNNFNPQGPSGVSSPEYNKFGGIGPGGSPTITHLDWSGNLKDNLGVGGYLSGFALAFETEADASKFIQDMASTTPGQLVTVDAFDPSINAGIQFTFDPWSINPTTDFGNAMDSNNWAPGSNMWIVSPVNMLYIISADSSTVQPGAGSYTIQ